MMRGRERRSRKSSTSSLDIGILKPHTRPSVALIFGLTEPAAGTNARRKDSVLYCGALPLSPDLAKKAKLRMLRNLRRQATLGQLHLLRSHPLPRPPRMMVQRLQHLMSLEMTFMRAVPASLSNRTRQYHRLLTSCQIQRLLRHRCNLLARLLHHHLQSRTKRSHHLLHLRLRLL